MTRRDAWLVITSLVLGPLIGGVTFLLFAAVTDGIVAHGSAPPMNSFLDYWPMILSFSYVLGAVPAILSAILMAIASRRLPKLGQRLIAAPAIGAAISLLIIGLIIFSDAVGAADDLLIASAVGLTGAVAGFLCLAIVEAFHPLPKPATPAA